jgi:CRISPR/Cas system CMR subunit Cmr4 (Cas7 group RAMP superfamily)
LEKQKDELMNDFDLNNSDQEFIDEMMNEMDQEESLLDEPINSSTKKQNEAVEDGIKVIEIDDEFMDNITKRCDKGSKPVTKLCIQIFNSVFNENEILGDSKYVQRKYIIFDPEVMKRFLNIYFEKVPTILKKV